MLVLAAATSVAAVSPSLGQVATVGQGASSAGAVVPNNTTGVLVASGQRTIYGAEVGGLTTTAAFLKIYDKATAPACGTDTPIKRLVIPGASATTIGGSQSYQFIVGINIALGLGYCITTGIADADTTAPAATTYVVNIDYK